MNLLTDCGKDKPLSSDNSQGQPHCTAQHIKLKYPADIIHRCKENAPRLISLVSQLSQFLTLTLVTYRQQGAIPTVVLSGAQKVQKPGKEESAVDLRC